MSGKIEDVLGEIDKLADREDHVSVGDVMDRMGHRGTGAFLLIPGILGASPLGAAPSVPTIMAAIVLILSSQIAFGRTNLWLPDVLKARSVDDDRLKRSTAKIGGVAAWIDRWFGNRLSFATGTVAHRLAGGVCMLLAFMIPPLELVPFAAAMPLGAVALFGLALILKDGLLMLLAFVGSVAALYGAWTLMPF